MSCAPGFNQFGGPSPIRGVDGPFLAEGSVVLPAGGSAFLTFSDVFDYLLDYLTAVASGLTPGSSVTFETIYRFSSVAPDVVINSSIVVADAAGNAYYYLDDNDSRPTGENVRIRATTGSALAGILNVSIGYFDYQ